MAYQYSGSKSANFAGMTAREQHEQYFEDRGNLQSVRMIFFEQSISQLIVWKHTDHDIILLGDFNKNVYSGRIAQCLLQPDLMFSEQCLQCTGIHTLPTFRDGIIPINANVWMHTLYPTMVALVITGVLYSTSHSHLLLVPNFQILSAALLEIYIASQPIWSKPIIWSLIYFVIATRCTKGFTLFILTSTPSPTTTFYTLWIIGTVNLFSLSFTLRPTAQNSSSAISSGAPKLVSGYHVDGYWHKSKYTSWDLAPPILATLSGIFYAHIYFNLEVSPTAMSWSR